MNEHGLKRLPEILSSLQHEPSKLFTIWLVVVAAIVTTLATTQSLDERSVSIALITLVGVTCVAPIVYVVYAIRKGIGGGSRRYKVLLGSLVVSMIAATTLAAHQSGHLQLLFPHWFPEHAVIESVKEYMQRMDRFLRAESDDELQDSFRHLALSTSERFRRAVLSGGQPEMFGIDDEATPNTNEALLRRARLVRGWYGGIAEARLECTTSPSWRMTQDGNEYFVVAVVSYRGQFLPNPIAKRGKYRTLDIETLAAYADGQPNPQIDDWILRMYPDSDLQAMRDGMKSMPVHYWVEPNFPDLLAFWFSRGGRENHIGSPSRDEYRFGNEVTSHSIRVTRDKSGRWLVDEVGRWGLERIFTAPVVETPVAVSQPRMDVPYRSQISPSHCQSAALEMLYLTMKNAEYEGGQDAVRRDLGDDPLAHPSRVKWAQDRLLDYDWEMVYTKTVAETVAGIRRMCAEGIPVVMSTRLTPSGHVIVVHSVERASDGEVFVIAHDPWGEFDFQRRLYLPGRGPNVRYPLRELITANRYWRMPDGKRVMQQFVAGTEEWIPSTASLNESGATVEELRQDWGWLSARPK